jgi:anti-anti-sigma factor
MNIKIDTKEIFSVITPNELNITANMAAEFEQLARFMTTNTPHLVVDMKHVLTIDKHAANALAKVQQQFYENEKSFVVCSLTKSVETIFEELELLDVMNITPTESEAWDIVQMEEIERELLKDF